MLGLHYVAWSFSSCGVQAELPAGMWNHHRSQTGIEPCTPCIGRQILNRWTTKEVPGSSCLWGRPRFQFACDQGVSWDVRLRVLTQDSPWQTRAVAPPISKNKNFHLVL